MIYVLGLLLGVIFFAHAYGDDGDVFEYPLEHSLSADGGFTSRGTVRLEYSTARGKVGTVTFSTSSLSDDESSTLLSLAESGGYYRLRILVDGHYLMASVPACAIVTSQLKEYMTFHADVYGNLIGFDYQAYSYDCDSSTRLKTSSFQSRARISLGRSGEKVRNIRSKEAQVNAEKGKTGDKPAEKGFLQKYWFYILLGLIFMNMGGGGGGADKK